jgi:two-component system, NtrC family, sensor kinase
MLMNNSRTLLHQLTERVRAMGNGDEAAKLVCELERLGAQYEAEQAEAILDARRHMANLEELHNANRLVTVGTLTVGMAHEFGTPLGVLLARAQMIVTDDTDIDEARSDAEEIIRQVTRMTQMCREVLDYARPKAPAKVPVDVVQIVRQMIFLLKPDARTRGAVVALVDEPPPTQVLGDSSKLMQIITNLIINGAQAMPKGGTVTLSVVKRRVSPPPVHGLPEADYVCIQVTDTGTGIRGADLPHVFDTFFTTKKQGSGLGLAVSYRIAREHDGWIGVDTQEGTGTTFTVYLPPL